jgi:NADH-quinone oxidoreductase subunit N
MQDNLKRMLAFSSVAHAGYLAIAVLVGTHDSVFGIMFYLGVYAIVTLGAFGVVALLEGKEETDLEVSSYRGLARRNPYLAAIFAVAMVTLAGFPPTAGFLGKYFVFNAAVDEGYIWLVVIAVINSLISVYYYLRPVVAMYMHSPTEEVKVALPGVLVPVFLLLLIVTLGLGIFPMALIMSSASAAWSLF